MISEAAAAVRFLLERSFFLIFKLNVGEWGLARGHAPSHPPGRGLVNLQKTPHICYFIDFAGAEEVIYSSALQVSSPELFILR